MENNRTIPAAGEFYRHFKGNLYQIVGIAKHSETMEQMVVYQALYGDYGLYTRPLELFLSPVDTKKYPQVQQKYRFEKCVSEAFAENKTATVLQEDVTSVENEVYAKTQSPETAEENSMAEESEETVREEILRFLDAEGAAEKLEVLRELRKNMDESLLTTIELSMDLLPDERESMERRFELVEQTLEKRIRFESGRLR